MNASHASPAVAFCILLQCCIQLPATRCGLGWEQGMAQRRGQVAYPLFLLPRLHGDAGRPRSPGAIFDVALHSVPAQLPARDNTERLEPDLCFPGMARPGAGGSEPNL